MVNSSNYAINLVHFIHWTHTRTRVFAGYRNVRNIMKKKAILFSSYLLLLLSLCSCSGVFYSTDATSLLTSDLNDDGTPEILYIEKESQTKYHLIVKQGEIVILRTPFYRHFKEPFYNTKVAIIYNDGNKSLQKPHLMVKGGRPPKALFFEYINGKMETITPSINEANEFN